MLNVEIFTQSCTDFFGKGLCWRELHFDGNTDDADL